MTHFLSKKNDTFFVKKRTSFFWSKMTESHFFSILESPAYISANRVGNFFYIEKWHFFLIISGKFPTHFPERYAEWRFFKGPSYCNFVEHFFDHKKVVKKVFNFRSFFCEKKCPNYNVNQNAAGVKTEGEYENGIQWSGKKCELRV
jgi:hypothetical protein